MEDWARGQDRDACADDEAGGKRRKPDAARMAPAAVMLSKVAESLETSMRQPQPVAPGLLEVS